MFSVWQLVAHSEIPKTSSSVSVIKYPTQTRSGELCTVDEIPSLTNKWCSQRGTEYYFFQTTESFVKWLLPLTLIAICGYESTKVEEMPLSCPCRGEWL